MKIHTFCPETVFLYILLSAEKKDKFSKERRLDISITNTVCYYGVRTKFLNINLFDISLPLVSGSEHLKFCGFYFHGWTALVGLGLSIVKVSRSRSVKLIALSRTPPDE